MEWAKIKLTTPQSAVRLASVARHVTDCATWSGLGQSNYYYRQKQNHFYLHVIARKLLEKWEKRNIFVVPQLLLKLLQPHQRTEVLNDLGHPLELLNIFSIFTLTYILFKDIIVCLRNRFAFAMICCSIHCWLALRS